MPIIEIYSNYLHFVLLAGYSKSTNDEFEGVSFLQNLTLTIRYKTDYCRIITCSTACKIQ